MMAAYVQGRQVSFTKARAVALEFELYTIFFGVTEIFNPPSCH